MGQLPIIPGFEVSTPIGGVQMDASAFREAALTRGKVAGAAGQAVAGFFEEVSQKIAATRDAKQVLDADSAQTHAYNDFIVSLSQNPELRDDPGKWVGAYQQKVDEVRAQHLDGPNVSRKAKLQLEEMFNNWSARTTLDVNMHALKREATDFQASGYKAYETAFQSGGTDEQITAEATTRANVMYEHHAIEKPERDRMVAEVPQKLAETHINLVLSTPGLREDAPEGIKPFLSKIPIEERKKVETAAKSAQSNQWADNEAKMELEKKDATTGLVPDQAIKEAVSSKHISPRYGEAWLARNKQVNEKADAAVASLVSKRAHDKDAIAAADSPEEWEKGIRAQAGLIKNEATRQGVLNEISNARKAHDKGIEKPTDKQINKLSSTLYKEGMFEPRIATDTTAEVPAFVTPFFTFNKTEKTGQTKTSPTAESNWEKNATAEHLIDAQKKQGDFEKWMRQQVAIHEQNNKGKAPEPDWVDERAKFYMGPIVEDMTGRAIKGLGSEEKDSDFEQRLKKYATPDASK